MVDVIILAVILTEFVRIELSPQLSYSSVSTTSTTNGNIVITAASTGMVNIAHDVPSIISAIHCNFCGACVCDKELEVSALPSGTFEHVRAFHGDISLLIAHR